MEAEEQTSVASALLAGRDRSALLAQLVALSVSMPLPDPLTFFVDLLYTAGLDRDRLKERIVALVAARFGRSSEQSDSIQLSLFAKAIELLVAPDASPDDQNTEEGQNEAASTAPPAPKPTVPELIAQTEREIEERVEQFRADAKARREAAQAARSATEAGPAVAWPTHLPIREVVVDLDPSQRCCSDPDCGCARVIIGRETSWQVERTVSVEVVLIHRDIFACPAHHGGPVIAPVPPKPVDKGHMGFDLAAHAIYLRYSHNLPIRRIVELLADEMVPVSEEMLHTLFTTTAERMQPVHEALVREVRTSSLVNVDDTPVLILDKEQPKGRRTGRIWLALGDERFAFYFSTPNWKAQEAEDRLGALMGTLQGDGYKAFKRLAKKQGIKLAGCMAHLRRKIRRAMMQGDPRAIEAMSLVGALYRIEKLARLQGLDEAGLKALRQERAVPIMAALRRWAVTVAPSIEPKSALGEAWTYLDNQWDYLQTYLSDGRVSIDNNAAERGLRRITIGRKLWLFFRSDDTTERAAQLASILTTARLHGANERAYLRWLLHELARREWSAEAARQLLPAAWLAAQQK